MALEDIDGDNDLDFLITGFKYPDAHTKLYTNDGAGVFTEVTNTNLSDVSFGSVAFADIDGDNDKDLVITGEGNTIYRIYFFGNCHSKIFGAVNRHFIACFGLPG